MKEQACRCLSPSQPWVTSRRASPAPLPSRAPCSMWAPLDSCKGKQWKNQTGSTPCSTHLLRRASRIAPAAQAQPRCRPPRPPPTPWVYLGSSQPRGKAKSQLGGWGEGALFWGRGAQPEVGATDWTPRLPDSVLDSAANLPCDLG